MLGSVWSAIDREARLLYEEDGGQKWDAEPLAVRQLWRDMVGRWVRCSTST